MRQRYRVYCALTCFWLSVMSIGCDSNVLPDSLAPRVAPLLASESIPRILGLGHTSSTLLFRVPTSQSESAQEREARVSVRVDVSEVEAKAKLDNFEFVDLPTKDGHVVIGLPRAFDEIDAIVSVTIIRSDETMESHRYLLPRSFASSLPQLVEPSLARVPTSEPRTDFKLSGEDL